MLLLIPLGPGGRAIRVPIATTTLIVLNLILALVTSRFDTAGASSREAELVRIAEWTLQLADNTRPGLTQRAAAHGSVVTFLENDPTWREEVESPALRERLEACLTDLHALRLSHPFYSYGFVPAEPSVLRLLAHQFLHVDFLHVAFNMLFLWTVGGLLELTLGPALFVPSYLAGGVAAALTHAALNPGSHDPVVGASGAVAAAMGMFATLHGRQPMHLALVVMLAAAPRILFLEWPAYVFLALWAGEQVFFASFGSTTLNVAFGAHIGGFVFGMVLGLVFRAWRGAPPDLDDDYGNTPPQTSR